MKKSNNPFLFFENYCLRTPLYSLKTFTDIFKDEKTSFGMLKKISDNKKIKESIYLASPNLHDELKKLNFSSELLYKKDRKLLNSFFKYLIRLSTRCTPFGLFAGISIGRFNQKTNIEVDKTQNHKRFSRLDTTMVSQIINSLTKQESFKNKIDFIPNSTLYRIGNQYRYIEYDIRNNKREYSIEGVEYNKYLEKIISNRIPRKIKKLVANLENEGFSESESKKYITLLIENQILVSDIEVNITGEDSLQLLLEQLTKDLKDFKNLNKVQKILKDIDDKIGNDIDVYQSIFELFDEMNISYQKNNLIQTDLFVSTSSNNLNNRIGYELRRAIPILSKLTPYKENSRLNRFKREFVKRYETKEIPLAIALDMETGISYNDNSVSNTTPFLEDFLPNISNNDENIIHWSSIDKIIHQKLIQAIHDKDYSIKIKHEDLEEFDCEWDKIPNTISAFTEIAKVGDSEKIFIQGFGAHGGNLLGRFAHIDSTILNHVENICSVERKLEKNKIVAEIVHLPEARTGNILKRPHLRNKEIVYLGSSTLPLEDQIFIDDLLVSVINDNVILKSKKYNKTIVPRLTNAHNYQHKSLPIYNFLCDLQFQNLKQYFGFSWSQVFREHPFLPRVEFNNLIISKARWYIENITVNAMKLNYYQDKELLQIIFSWRKRYQVPKLVKFVEGDNTLLINLRNLDSIRIMISSFKDNKPPILEEFLFSEDSICRIESESFTNECIITFYNEHKLKTLE